MKKAIAVLLTLVFVCSLLGCAKTTEQQSGTEIVNPVQESTAAEILETLGITLNVPKDAQSVSYFIINMDDGHPIAQAKFARNNVEYTYRIRSAPALEDISGAYYDWTNIKKIEVSYCSGELRYNEGKEGICLWYDVVPGLLYCIYTDKGASEETLLALANELYVPAEDIP
jgi:hypothetical protein